MALRENGINTWRDRDNLRGSDNSDPVLVHVIRNQIDYVLVLHTRNLMREPESCVYKEIKVALERQQKFAPGFCFIVPASLSDSGQLNELRHLHYVNLASAEGFVKLVKAIPDDWTRQRGDAG